MSDKAHFAAIGDYRFIIDKNTYDNLQRSMSYRWSAIKIINNRPAYQFLGFDEEIITINGAVFNYKTNQGFLDSPVTDSGTDQISQLRQQASLKKPLRFALDDGRFLGFWVIRSIKEQQNQFIGSAPLKQSYNLVMAYAGDKA